jgi:transcription elongation factor/antiterminator RfaH
VSTIAPNLIAGGLCSSAGRSGYSSEFRKSPLTPTASAGRHPWYGIRTRSNQERLAASALAGKGFECYLPTHRSRRRWSDRVVFAEAPLFPGYLFCRFNPKKRLPILSTPGIVQIVGFGKEPAAIPDAEIDAIQTVLIANPNAEPCSFLRAGHRVRVQNGVLKDVEGILVKEKSNWRLVVSIEILQRSVWVEVDRDNIEPA